MKLIYMSALIATSILLLVQGRSNSRLNGEHLRIATVHVIVEFTAVNCVITHQLLLTCYCCDVLLLTTFTESAKVRCIQSSGR